ncbi:ubiquitin carboxyl-terminal hydrolase 43-like isoform X2 [Liolophura sinensis]|uniref:ubiquitin carboxyl-terminal hydrolase 43-like isoform X2 n=1 Tax=Liolophura sinensis TaxID=3198878 RepID=UPI003158948F
MSETIPGGRQRSSSEGDLLDEDEDGINYGHQRLSPLHRKVSRSAHLSGSAGRSEYIENVAEREGISTLERKKKYKRPSFKAMKHSVMKMVRRTVNSNVQNGSDSENSYNVRAIVTPTLRRKSKHSESMPGETKQSAHKTNFTRHDHGNDDDFIRSGNRPLLTQRIIKLKGGVTPGTVGLRNHGNTCFMNAILQCLSHTDALTEYFIREQYKADLAHHNKSNSKKFGTKGEVLEQMAYLVHSLWTNRYTSDVSNHFKNVVGKYNNQYQGYSQHDAQEFLLWLLDKMHEDLNTVAKKKYKANKNQSPRRDEDLAEEATAFSKSFVSDLFQALYRSSLTCLNCQRQSNTFDPYLCVSLPLPQKVLRPVYVTIVYADARPKQVKIGLQCNVTDYVKDLRRTLASDTNIPESRLVLAQIYDDGFRNTYGDHQPLSDIPESETVYAVEMLPIIHPEQYQTSFIQIIFVNVEKITSPSRWFCSPQVMQVPRDLNFKELQTQILKHMADDLAEGLLAQSHRLNVLFRLRVVDGIPGKCYLNPDVDLPLYMETVDRALSFYTSNKQGYGPAHLKLVVEWDANRKEGLVVCDEDRVEEHSSVYQVRQAQQKPAGASLEECFQLYTQEEKLCGEDAWLCPYCKKQQQGTMKKLGLWSLPDVFVVHLKRFKQVGMKRNKLNTLVNFPVTGLNMAPHVVQRTINNNTRYCDESPSGKTPNGHRSPTKQMALLGGSTAEIYDLFAVCNHYGDMCGGHYTAFCKNPVDDKWYSFDDSKVTPMQESEVVTKAAYLLFYQRRSQAHNRSQELQQGNHWVYRLEDLVDPATLGRFVSPPGSPTKSRASDKAISPGLSRKKPPSTPSTPRAQPPPDSPPMQRHYSMPPQALRQTRNPTDTSPSSIKENQRSEPCTPVSPVAANNNNNKWSKGILTTKPPIDPRKPHLPPNHSVTFNVDQQFSSPDRPVQLYVALPREHSSSRPLSPGVPLLRSPGSGSSSSRSPSSGSPSERPLSLPPTERVQSPAPLPDERRRRAGGHSHNPEQGTTYRPTPRSKSHDILRPDETYSKNGGYNNNNNNPKFHTIERVDRRAERDVAHSRPDRIHQHHLVQEASAGHRVVNYARVISPQQFVGETQSLDRYQENLERFPRYQPQRHYAYLRYNNHRSARPVEVAKSSACLKESSV